MLPLSGPQLGTLPATQACALTRNRTGDLSVHRPASNPLSHTSPNWFLVILNNQLSLQGYQPWSRTNLFPRPSLLSPHSPLRTHKLGDLFSVTDSYLQVLANPPAREEQYKSTMEEPVDMVSPFTNLFILRVKKQRHSDARSQSSKIASPGRQTERALRAPYSQNLVTPIFPLLERGLQK